MKVAGVDGCRGGWVVALREGQSFRFELVSGFADVVEAGHDRIAVDMPIGLPAEGETRECDREARRLLGRRASCVFSAPPRHLLEATNYEQVRTQGLSLQSFHLLPKIREVDQALDPIAQQRVFETHPELVFARLAGAPLVGKRTPQGVARRRELLGLCELDCPYPRRLCALDDLLDAAALLVAGEQWGEGPPNRVPHNPPKDDRGLRMEICY